MKKLSFTLLSALLLSFGSNAQSLPCGNSGAAACTAVALSYNGFENPDSIECFESGVAGEVVVQFKNFTNLVIPGTGPITVYYLRIDSILNLPCGICWSTNKSNNVFTGGESGCIKFSGTTTDQVGQYKLKLVIKAQINAGSYNPQALIDPPGGLEAHENTIPNVKLYAKVKASGSTTCAAVDTSAGATNKVGNPANCSPNSIGEIATAISSLKVTPSNVNSTATVSVFANENSSANAFVTDIAGRVVWSKNMDLTTGENNFVFERSGISSGLYLMNIAIGNTHISKRFNITE
ncbi:MAG: T9SS type A sorting domain-containing protein [Chitinophagales bacterium]|nr:T9SS type A sorting domain-containing protein [Chitinophagales bacterium]